MENLSARWFPVAPESYIAWMVVNVCHSNGWQHENGHVGCLVIAVMKSGDWFGSAKSIRVQNIDAVATEPATNSILNMQVCDEHALNDYYFKLDESRVIATYNY